MLFELLSFKKDVWNLEEENMKDMTVGLRVVLHLFKKVRN